MMKNRADFNNLISLLQNFADNQFAATALASYIADKAFEAGHLYADMGLSSRAEMNRMMSENYPLLAKKRPPDIRWKKFLFDEIGSIAPACYGCRDVQNCFKCDILEAG